MPGVKDRSTIVVDAYTRMCLTAIAVLLTLLIVGLWATESVPSVDRSVGAERQVRTERTILPNAGAQRNAILKAIQATNQKLEQIAQLLEGGKVRVVLAEGLPGKGAVNVQKVPAQ